jgi:ABC-2 type transport system ATP-binding protein
MAALVPYEMSALTVSPASLEDLFLRQYADDAGGRDDAAARDGRS